MTKQNYYTPIRPLTHSSTKPHDTVSFQSLYIPHIY